MTDTQRTLNRRHEARKLARGGRRIPGGVFSPEVADALDWLIRMGYAKTMTGCITRAVLDQHQAQYLRLIGEKKRGLAPQIGG